MPSKGHQRLGFDIHIPQSTKQPAGVSFGGMILYEYVYTQEKKIIIQGNCLGQGSCTFSILNYLQGLELYYDLRAFVYLKGPRSNDHQHFNNNTVLRRSGVPYLPLPDRE